MKQWKVVMVINAGDKVTAKRIKEDLLRHGTSLYEYIDVEEITPKGDLSE